MDAKPKSTFKFDARVERFVLEYIIDFNGTRAAKAAGYEGDEKTLGVQASRLLKKAKVQRALRKALAQRIKRTEIRADEILHELYLIAKSDIRKLFNESGVLLPPNQWPDDIAAAVGGLTTDELVDREGNKYGETRKVKLWDKPRALHDLALHLGLFLKKAKDEGKTLEQILAESWEKTEAKE